MKKKFVDFLKAKMVTVHGKTKTFQRRDPRTKKQVQSKKNLFDLISNKDSEGIKNFVKDNLPGDWHFKEGYDKSIVFPEPEHYGGWPKTLEINILGNWDKKAWKPSYSTAMKFTFEQPPNVEKTGFKLSGEPSGALDYDGGSSNIEGIKSLDDLKEAIKKLLYHNSNNDNLIKQDLPIPESRKNKN